MNQTVKRVLAWVGAAVALFFTGGAGVFFIRKHNAKKTPANPEEVPASEQANPEDSAN